jgi:hypothetical protein
VVVTVVAEPQMSPESRVLQNKKCAVIDRAYSLENICSMSNESGRSEVYVTTFPDPGNGKWPISSGGGYQPRRQRDGKELLYFTGVGKLMSVEVTLTPSFKAGAPRFLFQPPIYGGGPTFNSRRWDLTPDGDRFLIITTSKT